MSHDKIHVCVCLPANNDNRPPQEQAEVLDSFCKLHPGIEFHFAEYIDSPEIRALRGQSDFERARDLVKPPADKLRQALAKAHVILCVDLPFDMDQLAPRLRWVQSVGAGIAQLQNSGLDRLPGVMLTNGAGITADPIAEFVLARLLSHWKCFSHLAQQQRQRVWKPAFGRDLAGSTLGIVGYGAIGQAIAWRAKAWGMTVLANRRRVEPGLSDPGVDGFFPLSELKAMLAQCDAVALTAGEGPATYQLFNDDTFGAMKPGSYFCNVSRGSLVDEAALVRALESGRLAAASIDVATVEPLPPDHPLWDAPNLAVSPHCSPTLTNFSRNAWKLFYDNMARFVAGKPLRNLRSCHQGE